ncbi:MAG: hypothetical protein ACI4PR_00225, partial [Acutalibacteraceae bacterium]
QAYWKSESNQQAYWKSESRLSVRSVLPVDCFTISYAMYSNTTFSLSLIITVREVNKKPLNLLENS